jgi:tight adherence protein C
MIAVAILLCGSAIAFLVMRLGAARAAVNRRVSGEDVAGEGVAETPARDESVKARVGGIIGALADSAGQTDQSQTRVLRSRLIQAGYHDKQALVWFFGLRIATATVLSGAMTGGALWFMPEASYAALGAFALGGAGLGFVAPSIALDRRIERLKREHSAGFPDFMDLMVVCAQAGLSMEASINRIAREISVAFPSLALNLELAARELRSGKPLAKAIESLSQRLAIAEAASFSTLLQQSEELGSSLTQSLRAYSDDMRNKRLMKAEEKAYALPAKLVVPLTLFVFPVLLVVLMLPVVISVSGAKL